MSVSGGEGPARRHLLRLLERGPDAAFEDGTELAAADVELVTGGLVAEAFASDDVTDGASALGFVHERLTELDDLLSAATREAVAALAGALVQEQAP